MNALTYDSHEEDWDGYEEPDEEELPGRPRRQFFNRKTAALAALITCALGFYAGVRIEKGQLSGSTTASAGGSAALTAAGGGAPAAAGGGSAAGRGTGARTGAGASRFGGGNASVGSVSSIRGKTLYLSDASGNTVKVTLSSATKISKTVTVASESVRPGDTVVIQGLRNSSGTLIATSVTDSGASTASNGALRGAGSGGATSSVGALFAPGGPPPGVAPGGPGGG